MRTDELYDRFASVFIIKETPSGEKHKTSFGVLTTIELNLQVELTKSCKQRAAYIQCNTRYKIAPAPADDGTVQPCTVV
jgi:hypothetical protein